MKRTGIRDVAEHAGVSIASVSNALNRPHRVSDGLRARVQVAAASLGYVPMPAARQLRAGRSGLIGITVINISNPFFGAVIRGVERAAASADMRVLAANSDDDEVQERDHLGQFERVQVEGALIAPFGDPQRPIARLNRHGIPVVLLDAIDEAEELSSVSFDNVAGGRIAAEHAREIGRRRILFLGSRREIPHIRDREEGVGIAAAAAGIAFRAERLDHTDPPTGIAYAAHLAAMDAAERPDVVVCSNDHLAMGLVRGLVDQEVRVPEDIAVIGYDDTQLASVAAVPLTSVRQPATAMGARAAEMLIDRIADPSLPRETAVFAPELMIRGSTRR